MLDKLKKVCYNYYRNKRKVKNEREVMTMRALKYRLTSGTIVTTLKEARLSGQGYTPFMENIPEKTPTLSPMRAAMLKQFGYASKKFKNKVVM
jgi:hypothetical protein